MTGCLNLAQLLNSPYIGSTFRLRSFGMRSFFLFIFIVIFWQSSAMETPEADDRRRQENMKDAYAHFLLWNEQEMVGKGVKIHPEEFDVESPTPPNDLKEIDEDGGSGDLMGVVITKSPNPHQESPKTAAPVSYGVSLADTSRFDVRVETSSLRGDTPSADSSADFFKYTNAKLHSQETSTGSTANLTSGTTTEASNQNLKEETPMRPHPPSTRLDRPNGKPVIYIAGLFPWSDDIPAGAVGRGVLPAVQIALDHVNNDARVNRKYILKMAYNDTRSIITMVQSSNAARGQLPLPRLAGYFNSVETSDTCQTCDMAVATKAFFDMMADNGTTTAMLFGDACYNVTGPMVQIAHQWGMFQLSYADTNPMLSDRDEFPNFYRTAPSDSDFNPARLALLRHFNWTTVGTLFQDAKLGEARHGYASNRFDSLVEKHKINISLVESFADDPTTAIKNLKDQDVRIIVGNFDQNAARKVFCSAHQQSMYGPKHQWIILGTYEQDWWKVKDDSVPCTPAQLNETLHGHLATDVLPLSTSHDVTESGRTSEQYLHLYNSKRGNEYSKYHGYAYDGVWVIAKALDRLFDDVTMTLEKFRGPMVGKVLNETGFTGVTGRVQFLNGDRVGSTTILQMKYGRMVKVGEYHALTDTLDLNAGQPIFWRDGKPPVDKSIKTEELRHVSFPVYIGFVVMAALGITIGVLFLALNIRFRRHRYIKMSSPNMNNLIIVGCILCYLSIFLLGTEPGSKDRTVFSYWCTARSWTLALGFTLSFGAMFGKTWRVHAIFTNIKLNKKVIKDYKLMLIVLVLVLLDAVILVTWQVVDPFDKQVKRLSPEVYADFEIIPKIDYCTSQHMEIWLGALYAYKGLLLAFGVFLAWETRHVSIPALNDSKYIGMSVYNVVIMCVCGAAVSFIIEDKPTQSFIIIGLFIIFCTTITLCLVFLPKIIQLKRNPKGDEQRVRATLTKKSTKKSKSESMQKEKIKSTLEENRRLRGFLEQKALELEHVLEQLEDNVIRNDLTYQSSFLHKKILELRGKDNSPGKVSVKSSSTLEVECSSEYSEISGTTTTMYMAEESPPTTSLLRNRFQNSSLHSEVIEMAGVRTTSRKESLTIPPQAEEEDRDDEDDPFGGVYLGPSESVEETNNKKKNSFKSNQDALGERQPLMAATRVLPYKAGNAASSECVFEGGSGAQGTPPLRRFVPRSLRLRRHSAPLAIWTIAESYLEDSPEAHQAKDTQPLVRQSPCSLSGTPLSPENLALSSPMSPVIIEPLPDAPRARPPRDASAASGLPQPEATLTCAPVVHTAPQANGPATVSTNSKVYFTCDVLESI